MKRVARQEIPRQGIVSPETARDRRERDTLAEDIRSMPLRGQALRLRLRNFRPSADGYLTALGGPLPYMIRLREIARLTAGHEARLSAVWKALAETRLTDEAFAAAWRAEVDAWSFDEVNDLIDRHNRFYPAESRLPMDPNTGTHALVGGEDYRRRPLDADWALERFPTDRVREASPAHSRGD